MGRKVSIRYALHRDPEYPFSEAIGVVMACDRAADGNQTITIVARSGDRISVAAGDILAATVFK